ncbi:hypothetical protein ACP4OV_020086 [Aristida adscensionis]
MEDTGLDYIEAMSFEDVKENLSILGKIIKAENLRTLMLFGEHHGSFSKTFAGIFREAKSLRVIFLSGTSYDAENFWKTVFAPYYNVDDLRQHFSQLVHLRYLRINAPSIRAKTLSFIISRLYNLVVLDLKNCNVLIDSLIGMRNLSNHVKLRHFLVNDDILHSLISEVGKLKYLQELRRFNIQNRISGFELNQLGKLLDLKGSLGTYHLERVAASEVDHLKLIHMTHLHQLTLHWDIEKCDKDSKQEEDILESLKPHNSLRGLDIRGHRGATCPTWLTEDSTIKNLERLCLDSVAWNGVPPLGDLLMVKEHGEECIRDIRTETFQNLERLELINIPNLKKLGGREASHLFSRLKVLIVEGCSELIELSFSHPMNHQGEHEENTASLNMLQRLQLSDCPKLISFPPVPCNAAMSHAHIRQVGTGIRWLSYEKNHQTEPLEVIIGEDVLCIVGWNMLSFSNLSEIKGMRINGCPPLPLGRMKMLTALKTLRINYCNNVLCPVEVESNAGYKFPVENLEIGNCGVSGKELTQLVSYFPNLSTFFIWDCEMVTTLGVARRPLSIASTSKTRGTQTGQQQQQERGEEIEAAPAGLLLLPPQLQELTVISKDLRLCATSFSEDAEAAGGLHFLGSLRVLRIFRSPKFLSSYSPSSSYSPFPTSLQNLSLGGLEGMFKLSPLPNLTKLWIDGCGDLTGEDLWHLVTQGNLTELEVKQCPKLFTGSSEPSQLYKDQPHSSRLQVLETDGMGGELAVPICTHLSNSLTKLVFRAKCFKREQVQALQMLTSLQELKIYGQDKLQSLPAGLNQLPNLKIFTILDCKAIRSLPRDCLPCSLTELKIQSCPAIQCLPKSCLPSSLEVLDVHDCGNEKLKRQCRKLTGTIPIIKA